MRLSIWCGGWSSCRERRRSCWWGKKRSRRSLTCSTSISAPTPISKRISTPSSQTNLWCDHHSSLSNLLYLSIYPFIHLYLSSFYTYAPIRFYHFPLNYITCPTKTLKLATAQGTKGSPPPSAKSTTTSAEQSLKKSWDVCRKISTKTLIRWQNWMTTRSLKWKRGSLASVKTKREWTNGPRRRGT